MASGILTIGGVDHDQADRAAANLIVDGFGWDLDGDSWLEFHEHHSGPEPTYRGDVAVEYRDYAGALRFAGTITSARALVSNDGRGHAYRCQGHRYRLNQHPLRARDGSGAASYNLGPLDDGYSPALAGRSVGWILDDLLTVNAAALAACGVATDAATAAQLAALTFVPPERVRVAGERLGDALAAFLQSCLPSKRLHYAPDGLLRVADVAEGTERTLTLGADPIDAPAWSRSWSDCATRIVARGGPDVDGAHVRDGSGGELAPAWPSAHEVDWKWSDFENPTGASDAGAVVSIDGPTQVTVSSAAAWTAANQWADRQARIYLTKTTALGVAYSESRPVVASAVKTAGGSAVLTLGYPLDNPAAGAYDQFRMVGTVGLASDPAGSKVNTYRLFNVTTPGGWIENHLVAAFPAPFPFYWLGQAGARMVGSPTAMLSGGGSGVGANFTVLPATGQILFDRPIVELFNSRSALELGGVGLVKPSVLALLAYSRGALEVPYPDDVGGLPVHGGTARDWAGLERTRRIDVPSWTYAGNRALVRELAKVAHETARDVVVEGSIAYHGAWPDVWSRGDGHRINVASTLGTTGDEALAIPVRGVSVRIVSDGRGGLLYATEIRCSTRRDPRCSTAGYRHLAQLGDGAASAGPIGAGPGWTTAAAAGPSTPAAGPSFAAGSAEDLAAGDDWTTPGGNLSGRYARKPRGPERTREEIAEASAAERAGMDARNAARRARDDGYAGRSAARAVATAERRARDEMTGRRMVDDQAEAKRRRDAERARRWGGDSG